VNAAWRLARLPQRNVRTGRSKIAFIKSSGVFGRLSSEHVRKVLSLNEHTLLEDRE